MRRDVCVCAGRKRNYAINYTDGFSSLRRSFCHRALISIKNLHSKFASCKFTCCARHSLPIGLIFIYVYDFGYVWSRSARAWHMRLNYICNQFRRQQHRTAVVWATQALFIEVDKWWWQWADTFHTHTHTLSSVQRVRTKRMKWTERAKKSGTFFFKCSHHCALSISGICDYYCSVFVSDSHRNDHQQQLSKL